MSETDDEITTEPPDPLAGADDSVAKVGEQLQEEAEDQEGVGDAPNTEDR
jgi:hypothetical protein